MCSVPLAVGIGMGLMQMMGTANQTESNNNYAYAEQQASNDAATSDYNQLDKQETQIGDQLTLQTLERQRQGARERASLRVAAGESGVGGLSVIREQANSMLQEGYDIGIDELNAQNKVAQTEAQKQDVYATAKGRYNVAGSKITSSTMSGLQILGAGVSGGLSGYLTGTRISNAMKIPSSKSSTSSAYDYSSVNNY